MSTTGKGNTTGRRSLDRLGADPRVDEVWYEGEDGYWVSLAEGYWCPEMECGTIHEHTVREVLEKARHIEPDPRPESDR